MNKKEIDEVEKYKKETARIKLLNDEINHDREKLASSFKRYRKEKEIEMEGMKVERDALSASYLQKKCSTAKTGGQCW